LTKAWLANNEDENQPLLDDTTSVQWDPQAEAALEAISRKIGRLSALSEG
jgi:hypothetical protein